VQTGLIFRSGSGGVDFRFFYKKRNFTDRDADARVDVSGGHGQRGIPEREETVRIWIPDNRRDDAVVATVAQQIAEGQRVIICQADDPDAPTSQQQSA
jgi:hypothetical protein